MNVSWLRKRKTLCFFATILILASCQTSSNQQQALSQISQEFFVDPNVVSLNERVLAQPASESYRFIVAGHIYGSHRPQDSHPAATILDNKDYFESLAPSMMILLGDIVPHASQANYEVLEKQFLSQTTFPIFNAVGNHDVEERNIYEQRYGRTFFTFQYGSAQYLFLDTEQDGCKISGTQKTFLEATINQAVQDEQITQIFVFMHKVLFFDSNLFQRLNTNQSELPNDRWACIFANNYNELLEDIFWPAAQKKPIYLFAGDVGAWGGNLTPQIEKYQEADLTTITTGIGDTPQDLILLISVNPKNVKLQFIPLDDSRR